MIRRAVFLDVDGTLVDYSGRIPASARHAVRAARANGHLVFLCTGRSRSELWPDVTDIGFDGLVGGAGAYVEVVMDQMAASPLAKKLGDSIRTLYGDQ